MELKNQVLTVSGHIDYGNAEQYYQKGIQLIKQHAQYPLVVDLSQLQQGSTLALAVFIRWLRQTPDPQALQFKSVPEKMMKIIQACHLQQDLTLL